MKVAYIIHGWGGSSEEEIHKWLKRELQRRSFKVIAPEMPHANTPKIEEWVSHLQKIAPNPDEQTYFIGHSIGCQAILRYLEKFSDKNKIGGAVLIAPWLSLLETAYENPQEEKKIAKP